MSSQPEYILEQKLVEQLQQLGHKKVTVCNEADLIKNLKTQLEIHNKKTFSDNEFEKILNHLSKGNVFEKAKTLRDRFHFLKMTVLRNGLNSSAKTIGVRISFRSPIKLLRKEISKTDMM